MARRLPIPNGRLDGALDANGQRIVNLVDPMSGDDAATKAYVDSSDAASAVELGKQVAAALGGKQDKLDASQLAAVNSGITAEGLAQMVTRDDVQPRDVGSVVIARIGGKEIKAPAGGGGAVESVNGRTGAVALTGEDIQVGGGDSRFVVEAIHNNESTVFSHISARDNPHGVTTAQIGAVKTTDPRLTDARTPTAHAASHGVRGSDPITPESIGAIPNGGTAAGLAVGPIVMDGGRLWLGYDTWGGEVPGGGSWDMISRYIDSSGEVETLPEYLAANYAAADQLAPISAKVDAIAESVSTDNRLLVNDTTVAIQTRENEDAEWSDEIRLDKGYDALQGTEMVKLDKSVQTVTVSGGTLEVILPELSSDGTVRDLCLYVNNTDSTSTVAMTMPNGTYYGADGWDAPAQKGGITGYYFSEIPGNGWRVSREELKQFRVPAEVTA